MNRLNLFFMFLSALVSSALHYTFNEEGNLKQALKVCVYRDEAVYEENFSKADLNSSKAWLPDSCQGNDGQNNTVPAIEKTPINSGGGACNPSQILTIEKQF